MTNRPYRYEMAVSCLVNALGDLQALSGDVVGPPGVSWQDIAGTAAVNLRVLANMLDQARAGNVAHGPVVFPSVSEAMDAANESGNSRRAL